MMGGGEKKSHWQDCLGINKVMVHWMTMNQGGERKENKQLSFFFFLL